MFKTLTAHDLAHAIARLLTDDTCHAVADYETHQSLMSDLAETVCAHTGGTTTALAERMGQTMVEWAVPVELSTELGVPHGGSVWDALLDEACRTDIKDGGSAHLQLDARALSELVTRLLTEEPPLVDSYEGFQSLMTDLADTVCRHCGGETTALAELDLKRQTWSVWIAPNDSLPADGGIWADYDPGVSFAEDARQAMGEGALPPGAA